MTAAATATAATAMTVAMMTPNGDEDNEDGNSKNKNNGKVTRTLTATTEGGERCQSRRGNRDGGHCRPRDAAIELGWLVATRFRWIMLSFPGREVYSLLYMGIHRKSRHVSSCIRGRRCHAGQETRRASSPSPRPHWNSYFYQRNKHGKRSIIKGLPLGQYLADFNI